MEPYGTGELPSAATSNSGLGGGGKGGPSDLEKMKAQLEALAKMPQSPENKPTYPQLDSMRQPSPMSGTYQPSFAELFKSRQDRYRPR